MRELGELGMSIQTSLAFESDESKFNLKHTDNLLINFRTLIRNAIGSYPPDEKLAWDVDSVVASLMEDLKGLGEHLKAFSKIRSIKLVIYYPTYRDLPALFPKADLWKPTKPKQLAKAKFESEVYAAFVKRYPGIVKETNSRLTEFEGKGTIISHHPVDLCLTRSAARLSLLESHTGAVKPYIQWYTKLTGGSEMPYMPLNSFTIQIFGDRSVNFKSGTHALKTLVRDLAAEGKWTSATTMDRIRLTIQTKTDGVTRAGLLLLLNT